MPSYILFLAVLATLYGLCASQCAFPSCKDENGIETENSGCLQPNPSCKRKLNEQQLTSQDIAAILNEHNQRRSYICRKKQFKSSFCSGRPKNMRELIWASDLAYQAQKWADQCIGMEHDKCRTTIVNGVLASVGQNLYSKTYQSGIPYDRDWGSVLQSWVENEMKGTTAADIRNFTRVVDDKGEFIGHLTQALWADTREVGCGLSVYEENGDTVALIACNYRPVGNIEGGRVWETTGGCPLETKRDRKRHLCVDIS